MKTDIDGLVQDRSISIANALEILRSCTKPSICKNISLSRIDFKSALISMGQCKKDVTPVR